MITSDSKNILVADDSVFFRTKLSDILVEAGHKVRFARNGQEVLNEVSIDSNGIDLLVLDLQMPDIDGFEVLKRLEDDGFKDKFPVLVITGVYEPADVMDRLKKLGAQGLVSKGFTPEQIIFRVNKLLFAKKGEKGTPRKRVPVSVPVDFKIGENFQTGYLLNISESGVFLHTKAELLPGAMLALKFSLPGIEDIIEAKGIVRWTTSDIPSRTLFGGGGIMFTTIDQKDQKTIREFVEAEHKRLGLEDLY